MAWELLAAQAIQTALNTAAEGPSAQISAFAGMLDHSAAALPDQQLLAPGQLGQTKPTELAAHASTHSHTTFPNKAMMSQADHPYQGSLQVPAIAAHPQLTTRASGPAAATAAAAAGGGQKAMTAAPAAGQQIPQALQPRGDLSDGGTTDGSISESEREDPAAAAAAAQGYASDSEADRSSMDGNGPELTGDAHRGPLSWQHAPQVGAPADQAAGIPPGSFAAPASTPATAGSSIISALAAALRQQQGSMAPMHSLAPAAAPAAAQAPAPLPGPQHGGMGMGVDLAQPPLSATADLLQLLVGLVRQASSRQQAPPATGARTEGVGGLTVGADRHSSAPGTVTGSIPMQQQQQQQREQQYLHWQQQLHAAVASSAASARPTSSGALTAVSPAAMAVAAALTGIKPVIATSAAPAAAAVPHLAAAAVPAIMKRKASSSLPSSPGVLSPAAGGMYPAGISSSMTGQLLSSLAAQIPVQPHGCFNGNFFPAPPAAPAAGRARPGGNAGTAAPSAWMGSAAAGAGAQRGRGFPTRATPEPDDEADATDDEFDIRATAALAAAAARGGAGVCMQDDACEGMDVDVSPSMAAAAAAMAGLAGLNCNSSGGGSAAAAGGSAAAGAVKAAQAQRSRKAQRLAGDMDGSQGQAGALACSLQQYQQAQYSQHGMTSGVQSSSAAAAAAAAATAGADVQDPAAAAAAMLAGSLSWAQHWYGSWAPPAAAEFGAPSGMAAGLPDATAAAAAAAEAGAYPWGQHTAGTVPVGMGWGSAPGQQQQQQMPAPRQRSKAAAGKAGVSRPQYFVAHAALLVLHVIAQQCHSTVLHIGMRPENLQPLQAPVVHVIEARLGLYVMLS